MISPPRGRDGLSTLTDVDCPTGCGNKVVYNGNYFCDNFENCGWAMTPAGERGYKPVFEEKCYEALIRARSGA